MMHPPENPSFPVTTGPPFHDMGAFVNASRQPDRPVEDDSVAVDSVATPTAIVSNYFRNKHRVDWCITLALSMVALPVIALTAILILILDGRPIFYRQIRVGSRGRTFRIWKFRTMRPNAEKHTGAVWSNRTDPRVTRLGRWMRCCHLDELPQFFNILSGDMNLIGPRPERPEFVQELARDLPGYMHRTEVRPGITGLAQLRLGYDEQISEVSKKVNLDLRYIRTASLRLDLSLLVWTIPYISYQVLSRMVVSLRNWSRRDEPERAIVPLVSPTSRIDGPEESLVPEPHFPPADQCKESKSGEPRRCSA